MKNVPSRATGEALLTVSRRRLLYGAAIVAPLAAVPALAAAVPASTPTNRLAAVEADPIFAVIETHREARDAFEAASKGATDKYLESAEYAAIDDAERVAWNDLLEVQPTTAAGLAAFAAHVLHSPALGCDAQDIRAILTTIAVASAKFAYLSEEAGR